MCPFPRRLVNGDGGYFERGRMVAHCLLLETPSHGLALVDTGLGEDDKRDPTGRLGRAFTVATGLGGGAFHTALEQVRALGFDPRDVRNILVTHLDLDHAGGLPDFPEATVHLHADERDAALHPRGLERERYRRCHFAHGPKWSPYPAEGEPWKGFRCVRSLPGLPPEVLALPLPGHTRGHACIAVDLGGRWLVHGGDALFHRSIVEPSEGPFPAGLRAFERLVAMDLPRVLDNHKRLRELVREHREEVTVFSAHDSVQFDRLVAARRS